MKITKSGWSAWTSSSPERVIEKHGLDPRRIEMERRMNPEKSQIRWKPKPYFDWNSAKGKLPDDLHMIVSLAFDETVRFGFVPSQ